MTYWKNLNHPKIDLLFSCVPNEEIKKVYPPQKVPNLHVENVLTVTFPKTLSVPMFKRLKIDL